MLNRPSNHLSTRFSSRLSPLALLTLALVLMPLPALARPAAPAAPQALAQAGSTLCHAPKTALLETLLFWLSYAPEPPSSEPLTPEQLNQIADRLPHQLRLIAQLPQPESQINPLLQVVSNLEQITAAPALEAAQQSRLQPVAAQAAAQAAQLGPENSGFKAELLSRLGLVTYRLGQPAPAQALWQQTQQAVASIQGKDFQSQALITLAEKQIQANDREDAFATLAAAVSAAQSITPSADYPGKRDDMLSRIVPLYSQLDAFPQAIALASTLGAADSQGYAQVALVQALLNRQQIEPALSLADTIRQPELKGWALAEIASDYAAQGQTSQATALFDTAFATARQPAAETSTFYPELMAAQVLQDYSKWQPDAALTLAQSLENPAAQALALLSVAAAYRSRDRSSPANALFAQVLTLTQQVDTEQHLFLGDGLVAIALEAKSYDWALDLARLTPINEQLGDLQAIRIRHIAYTALEHGELTVALDIIEQMPEADAERNRLLRRAVELALKQDDIASAEQIIATFAADALPQQLKAQHAIAFHEHQSGQTSAAKARLDSTLAMIDAVSDPVQQGTQLIALVAAYAQIGETAAAAQQFAAVLRLAAATNETLNAAPAFLNGSTQPLIEAGLYAWAYQLAQVVPTYELQTPEVLSVMHTLLGRQDLALAAQLIPTTRSPEHKTQLLIALADHAIALDQIDQASLNLAQALAAARTIPDPEVRQTHVMGAAAYDYNDFSDRASQLEAIAQRYTYLNQPNQAQQTLNLIQTTSLRQQLSQQLTCPTLQPR